MPNHQPTSHINSSGHGLADKGKTQKNETKKQTNYAQTVQVPF